MIVNCEECGKKYQVDTSQIEGKAAKFKCKDCGQMFTVAGEEHGLSPRPDPSFEKESKGKETLKVLSVPGSQEGEIAKNKRTLKSWRSRRKALGLRSKMLLLFFIVPITIMAGASFFYMRQLEDLSNLITHESSTVVTRFAENAIEENAMFVANQVRVYLAKDSNLKKAHFNNDPEFKNLAVQKVGKTGYTALYELPGPDGAWRTWAHVNEKIVGIDMSKLKEPLGKNFDGFWKVFTGVRKGKASKGYYTWRDKDGNFRNKYMACVPVKGTPFIIASTTYLDEFTMPMERLKVNVKKMSYETIKLNAIIFGAALIVIGFTVPFYGYRLTKRIRYLTDIADRISVGDLNAKVEIKSKDEIGGLAEAIVRMQESIRLSIQRLRRRK